MQKGGIVVVLGCISLFTDILEARDWSLDLLNYTRHRRESGEGCILPPYPEHGEWKLLSGEAKPGDKVTQNTVLKFECSLGYKLSHPPYIVCDDKWRSAKFPECEALCPPFYSSATVQLNCKDKGGKEAKCSEATEGTYLSFTCAQFYETPFGYKKTLLCSDGTWNYPKPVCQPVCGKTIVNDAKPLIFGVKPNERLEYPWVTAVYLKIKGVYENVCGGSILSLTVVLTAAHCVTNDYGDVLSKEDYLVGAGKLYREYQAREDKHAQYLEVSKIVVHDNYKGDRRRFLGDIAVLVTKGTFMLNDVVQPVCFNDVNNIPLHVGNIGEVSGWGRTEGGAPAEVLRTLKIPYKYETTCALELPPEWADKYNVEDKICAGFINQSTSVCDGDSGSGLAFKNSDDNRYYLHGLVSLAPTTEDKGCNIQQNSLYTKVAYYYEFIDRLLTKHSVNIRDCVLPSHPQNGKWIIDKQDRNPGETVPSNTILKVKCNLGFKLSSVTGSVECAAAQNMPSCQLLCPTLAFPYGAEHTCTDKDGKIINCLDAVDGSTLHYSCPVGYKFPEGTSYIRSCVGGSWGSPQPECLQDESTSDSTSPSSISPTPTQPETSPPPPKPSINGGAEPLVKVICVYAASKYYDNKVDPGVLDSTLCTHVIYSAIGLEADGSLQIQGSPIPSGGTKTLFNKVSDMKLRNPKLKVLLSVQGSGNKNVYTSIAKEKEKRATFLRSVTSFMEIYNFDGLDICWIIPQVDEKEIYIDFLKEAKVALKAKGFLITASVYVTPTYSGYNAAEMAKHLDWINVQNYDHYFEGSKYTGQYSAFHSSDKESQWEMEFNNLVNSAGEWEVRGMKKEKIAMSVAFYGRYFTLEHPERHDIHDKTVPGESGVISYSEICQKFSNWTRVWDDEQKNPYKFSGNKWFGYDDTESVKIKAEFIIKQKFFGVHVYSIDADDVQGKCGPKQGMLKYLNSALGNHVNLNN